MAASSEQQSAPVIVITPATAQARISQPGAPVRRDDSADVRKIPEPIIEPTTIIVASSGPRRRTRCASPNSGFASSSMDKVARAWLKLKPSSQTLIQSLHIDRMKLSHYLDDAIACD